MLKYIIQNPSSEVPPEELVQAMLDHLPKDEEVIMTTAEQLMHKGELAAKLQIAQNLLSKGLSIDVICEITQLSIEEVKQLQKK